MLGLVGGAATGALVGFGTGCSSRTVVNLLPVDQVVLGMSSAPGFAPTISWPLQSPGLVAYGSGRVLSAEQSTGSGAVPLAYTDATVDRSALARLIADAEQDRVLDRDFGDPQVTDQGSTRVWLQGAGDQQEASIYAFSESMDRYVSWRERRHRLRLRQLLDDVRDLRGDAGVPYVPERVVVLELTAYKTSDPATIRWPGPSPESFLHRPSGYARQAIACGELTGGDAAAVYAAARENPEQQWLVGGRTRVLAVNPLPIEIDC